MNQLLLDDIVFHYKHPIHRGTIAGVQPLVDVNRSCGDEIELYLVIKNGRVANAKFSGSLCSIANYGAELLVSQIINQPIAKLTSITSQQLLDSVNANFDCSSKQTISTANSLLENPTRLRCFETAQRAFWKISSQCTELRFRTK